jgi:hypothetical protein
VPFSQIEDRRHADPQAQMSHYTFLRNSNRCRYAHALRWNGETLDTIKSVASVERFVRRARCAV